MNMPVQPEQRSQFIQEIQKTFETPMTGIRPVVYLKDRSMRNYNNLFLPAPHYFITKLEHFNFSCRFSYYPGHLCLGIFVPPAAVPAGTAKTHQNILPQNHKPSMQVVLARDIARIFLMKLPHVLQHSLHRT